MKLGKVRCNQTLTSSFVPSQCHFPGVEGNHGFAPIAFAYDNHLTFHKTNKFLLGLLKAADFSDHSFWKKLGCN